MSLCCWTTAQEVSNTVTAFPLIQVSLFCLTPEPGTAHGAILTAALPGAGSGDSHHELLGSVGSEGSWVLASAALPQHPHGWAAKGAREVCGCTVVLGSAPGTGERRVTLPREGDEPPPTPQLLCWQLAFVLGV